MPKDKAGNKLTWKEYMARWKKGIEGVTVLQQVTLQIRSTYVMVIGLLCGLVVCVIGFKTLWWLSIILAAALFNVGIQMLGLYQKKFALEYAEQSMMKLEGGYDVKG
jgi:CHASE2 domain-containing sensor protein